MKFLPWRDYKEVAGDLKSVYRSATEEEALRELDQVEEKWRVKYLLITRSWRQNWDNLNTLFPHDGAAKKVVYLATREASKREGANS
jgi:putative transposase